MKEYENISRRQFVKIGAGAAGIAALTGLAGCTGGSSSGSAASGSASASASASDSAAAATTQKIVDLKGAEVEVPLEINKIIDLWHAHNQVILMLGAGDKLVGTTDNFQKGKWAQAIYPRITEVEVLVVGSGAGEVNYEEALKLEPDVAFTSDDGVTETARKQGITTVNVAFQDYEGLRNDVALTGKILGGECEKAAETWAKMLDENIAFVAERMKKATGDPKRVLHIVSPSSFTMVDGPDCIVDEWIKLAGGVNAIETPGNRIELTAEEIVSSDPDIIIIGSATPDDVENLKNDDAYKGLRAVQEGNVFANPKGVFPWDRYSGEEALQVLWAAKFFNPELFEDVDMVEKTKEFCDLFYGVKITDDQAERMLTGRNPD